MRKVGSRETRNVIITFCHCFNSLCPGFYKVPRGMSVGVLFWFIGWFCCLLLRLSFGWEFFLSMSYRFCLNLNCDWLEDMSQKRHISLLKGKKNQIPCFRVVFFLCRKHYNLQSSLLKFLKHMFLKHIFLNHRNSALEYKIKSSALMGSCYSFLVIVEIFTASKCFKNL